jgi:hypothetical protein
MKKLRCFEYDTCTLNRPNKFECYIALDWSGFQGQILYLTGLILIQTLGERIIPGRLCWLEGVDRDWEK